MYERIFGLVPGDFAWFHSHMHNLYINLQPRHNRKIWSFQQATRQNIHTLIHQIGKGEKTACIRENKWRSQWFGLYKHRVCISNHVVGLQPTLIPRLHPLYGSHTSCTLMAGELLTYLRCLRGAITAGSTGLTHWVLLLLPKWTKSGFPFSLSCNNDQ